MKHLFLDFETHFDNKAYTLRDMSPPEYILDRRFEVILLAAYDPSWSRYVIIEPSDIPILLRAYPPESTTVVTHNALFDMSILSWRYGYVPARMHDTLGMSRALLPLQHHSLGVVAKALGLGEKRDTILKVSGMHREEIMAAGLWKEFCQYAGRDVVQCAGIYSKLLPRFPAEERTIMDLVLRCAVQPVLHGDVKLLREHLFRLRASKEQTLREANHDRSDLMSNVRFQELLEELGVEIEYKDSPTGNGKIPCFAKTDKFMADLQEYYASDEDTNFKVQTLAAARLAHRSTIEETRAARFLKVASLPWANGYAGAPLLPIPLRYGGAHTGRLSGEWSMNFQNLPRDKTKSKLRKALVAPSGHKIITADLSQIEARITAKFCGQLDLLDEFRRGEDVYANFATVVFKRKINKADDPVERFVGKTAVLGCNYGCGAPKFFKMVQTQARQAGIYLEQFNEYNAEVTVQTYRKTFGNIPSMWRRLDRALASVLLSRSTQIMDLPPVKIMTSRILLPNGMNLSYDLDDAGHLYGAKLLENIIQSLARIVVMQAGLRLHALGLRFVLQAHDELVFVVPDADVETCKPIILTEMTREPTWLPGVPLAAEIGVGQSYGDAK